MTEEPKAYQAGDAKLSAFVPADSEAVALARVMVAEAERIGTLHRMLVDRRQAVEARRQYLDVLRAHAEQEIIDAAGGEKALGANEAARERALAIALAKHDRYDRARTDLVELECQYEALRATIEHKTELQSARRWLIRALTPTGGQA